MLYAPSFRGLDPGDPPALLKPLAIALATLIAGYVAIRFGLSILDGGNYWTLGDWLINYQAGFVRRGLSGTVTLWLSDHTGLDLTLTAGAMMLAAYLAMVALCLLDFAAVQLSAPVLMLMFSPVLLLMPFYYVKSAMLKETLGFLVLAMLACAILRGRRGWIWAGALSYGFACYAHEAMCFLLPFLWLFAALFRHRGLLSPRAAWAFIGLVTVIGISAMGLSVLFQGHGLSPRICDTVLDRGVVETVCATGTPEQTGPIPWLELTAAEGMRFARAAQIDSGIWPQYLLGYALAIAPFFLFRVRAPQGSRKTPVLLGLLVVGILLLAPLFVVASDWGRWIGLYVFALTMLALPALHLGLIDPRRGPFLPLVPVYALGWSLIDYGGGLDPGMLPKLARAVERLLQLTGLA